VKWDKHKERQGEIFLRIGKALAGTLKIETLLATYWSYQKVGRKTIR
jgi:hypothetical protein